MIGTENSIKSNYLAGDRSVNIKNHMEERDRLEKSGLADIEILDSQKQMGKDEFLKLLVTQLSHQDPTSPMKDQEFIAQMAQFSSLEQMHNIAGNLGSMADRQAMALVGKFVSGPDQMNGDDHSGTVEALFFSESGEAMLKVGDKAIRVKDVKMVSEPDVILKQAMPLIQESLPVPGPAGAKRENGKEKPVEGAPLLKEGEPQLPETSPAVAPTEKPVSATQEKPVSLYRGEMASRAYESAFLQSEKKGSFFTG